MYDLKLSNGNCYIDGQFRMTNIYIKSGKIQRISEDLFEALEVYDCTGLHVLPGLIDPHVHMALDLGTQTSADDFVSGSKAAAYGGVTTFLDFLDPIYTNEELQPAFDKRLKLAKEAHVDYGFHCTLGNYKGDVETLREAVGDLGITTIKVFTAYSESDRRCSYDVIQSLYSEDMMVMAHAEDDSIVISDYDQIKTFEESRNQASEQSAIERLIVDHRGKSGDLYVVHTTSGKTLENLFEKYNDEDLKGVHFESCPQYFYLSKERFKEEDGAKYLLAPPLRSSNELDLLKKKFHLIGTIGTDHCPFMFDEKMRCKDASKVPKGVGGIEYSFQLMYTLYGFEILDNFTKNVSDTFKLSTKGYIKEGFDADFCIFDTSKEVVIDSGVSRCDYSVFEGIKVKGQCQSTILRGQFVLKNRVFCGGKGQYLRRG